jgi:hypothetical protein
MAAEPAAPAATPEPAPAPTPAAAPEPAPAAATTTETQTDTKSTTTTKATKGGAKKKASKYAGRDAVSPRRARGFLYAWRMGDLPSSLPGTEVTSVLLGMGGEGQPGKAGRDRGRQLVFLPTAMPLGLGAQASSRRSEQDDAHADGSNTRRSGHRPRSPARALPSSMMS